MTEDVTRGEGIRERGPREAREADIRRGGAKGGGIAPGTGSPTGTTGTGSATDTTGTGNTTGTHAAAVAGHDTTVRGGTPGFGEGRAPHTAEHTKASAAGNSTAGSPLLPHDECDKLTLRLQHAVGGFVDEPRSAVEEADHVLEDVAARFADAMTQRRRTLRASWQTGADDRATSADTEQLRLALRDYRELTERLLRL
ncbi:hypothetical protein ACWD26_02400 [Streptomyces sp. NPDC002787]